ncbi:MAG: RNA-directed DNA polymerase, partial [Candidatus Omnitrophica bacterium]|nr:RNA-directed DNA polymerase [Candidatus Omnitrophota bacterium]
MRLTKSKKMYLAFQRAVTDLEGCVAPDPFKYCEYDYELDATIRELLDDLSHYEYRPKRAETFNMPKGELALRPGLIIHLFDLTVLHYLLSDFIFALDEKLPPGVTAYRIRKDKKNQFKIKRETAYYVLPKYRRHKIKVEEPWYNLWPEFRKQLREDLESEKFKYVACTDITAFFEDVNLNTLAEILKNKAGRYSQDINLIIEIYKSWALRDPMNVRQERGLPQSVNISGILSNYYLDVLDEFLEKERKKSQKIKWYRYCDDITILCTTKERARHLLLRIGALLRNLGLNQNARKTKILSAQEAVDELFNESADRISELISKSQKKGTNRKTLVEQLRREYKKISKKRKLDKNTETSLMRLYTASSILDVPMLINRVGSDFKRFPVRARNFSAYGRRFINYKRVLEEFRQLLHQRKRLPLFNYQLAFLVTVFRNLKKPNAGIYKAVLELCHDNKWHWFVRAQSISTLFYMGVGS